MVNPVSNTSISFPEFINVEETATDIIQSRLARQAILEESARNGGPNNERDAILTLMDYCKVGIRAVAYHANIKRTKLKAMLNGTIDMDIEVVNVIHDLCKAKKPDLFK